MTEFRKLGRAEFDVWHEQYKREHGYPLQGRNAATGQLVDKGWTTDYVAPLVVDGVAFVAVDIADVAKRPGVAVTKAEFEAAAVKVAPVLTAAEPVKL